MTELYLATEDELGEAVADRLVLEANQGLCVAVRMGRKGNSYLRKKLPELIRTAQAIPVLLLTDLDRLECPPMLIANWHGRQDLPEGMLFRVAVRETEAWLLADREGFAHFAGVPLNRVPQSPESLDDPKRTLLELVRRHGRRAIKVELLPERGSKAKVGLGYNQILSQFVRESWSPTKAISRKDYPPLPLAGEGRGEGGKTVDGRQLPPLPNPLPQGGEGINGYFLCWKSPKAAENADSLTRTCRRLHELGMRRQRRG